jgi:methionyl-tRNA synthetase
MAGKDQVRFQSLMWQAMLMSAGIKNTDAVFYHGFITSEGRKMSKSLGNVISAHDLVANFGTDAARYLLLRHVSPFDDSDLTPAAIREHYTAHLTNGLGNLVARVMKLAEEHLAGPVVLTTEDTQMEQAFIEKIGAFRFNEALDLVFEHIAKGDAYMTEKAPYKTIKSADAREREEAQKTIEKLVRHLAKVAAHLAPAMPATSRAILEAVRMNKKPDNLFPRI